jgi:hypothetical protein
MSYDGLRDWLVQVDAMNELRTLEGVDWNLEMGAVVDDAGQALSIDDTARFKSFDEFPRRYRCLQAI